MRGLIGKKLGMTQVFGEGGERLPVTVVEMGPCVVTQVRTAERDHYNAVQVGFGDARKKLQNKAAEGHLAASGKGPFRTLAEFRVDDPSKYQLGQEVKISDVFSVGDVVDVTGVTKGRGFSGVMRRHHFGGHRATHGTHESFRGAGGIGACAYPGRVFKGKKMAGQMGDKRRTIQNLSVIDVREEDNVLLVRGPVPGARGAEVVINYAAKAVAVTGGRDSSEPEVAESDEG